jgi:hypothetical protein
MSSNKSTIATLRDALLALGLLVSAQAALAQSAVTLSASATNAVLPDGQSVPMWGYFCGAVDPASNPAGASCTAMNGLPQAGPAAWQPPLIRVPAGQALTITLNNLLAFGAGDQAIPTSIVIDGQVGGGLGAPPTRMASPVHLPQGTTWPGTLGGVDTVGITGIVVTNPGMGYTSAPAVTITGTGAGGAATATATLTSTSPMGVQSIAVSNGGGYTTANVAIAPPGCVIDGVTCIQATATATIDLTATGSADAPATFQPPAQADRVRSFATEVAAGGTVALTWNNLRPGTYLIHSGTEPSIQHGMGLYGVLVVTEAPATGFAGTAYATNFDADVPLLFSEIDPAQNLAVDAAVRTAGFNATAPWAGPGACKNGVAACYPPAVNYSPRYYLINGTSFDRTNALASTAMVPAAGASGTVLLRIVNAGQRTHVPAVVGADMTLLAEDGNKVPGGTRMQSSIPMPPGKTFDVAIKPGQSTAGTYDNATLPVYDRELSLSTNNQRDGGMQAYVQLGSGAATGTAGSSSSAVTLNATSPTFNCVAGTSLAVTDVSRGVLGGAVGASGVSAPTGYTGGLSASNLVLNADGTFSYTQAANATTCGGTFSYLVNGTLARTATIAECDAGSHAGCTLAAAPTAQPFVVVSSVASRYASPPPGVMAYVSNPGGLALSATATAAVNADGSFVVAGPGAACALPNATLQGQVPAGATCVAVPYTVKDAQGQTSSSTGYVAFLPGSGLVVHVNDAPTNTAIAPDYRWIIEEDRTFWVDPKCQVNSTDPNVRPASCPPLPVESLGYNFHSAHMPVVAEGCVGTVSCEAGQKLQGASTVCDVGNGACRPGNSKTPVSPADVHLDPNKRYYISILPGDAINPTASGYGGTISECGPFDPAAGTWQLYNPADGSAGNCGHEMGGAQIAPGQAVVNINLQQIPLPTAKISVFVFQDDNPLNGENDAGGGVDVIAPNEPGLGGFEVKLFDQAGQLGDNTGQITYDEFNEPVSNSLAGYIDPTNGQDACPITARKDALVGMVPTCPKYEADGVTPSPLAGQVVIANLYPGLYEIQAYPAADRIARGEQWLQTNTLDGGKPHEAFIIPNEPGYFQEFGPGSFHVAVGFANPAIINARKAGYCASSLNPGGAAACTNTLNVEVSNNHMSRSPDQRTYDTESYDHYAFTQCYVSVGPADSEDFAIQPCVMTTGADGKTHAVASFDHMPPGTFKMSVFDQWNDIMLDGLVGTVQIGAGTTNWKFPVTQWRTNLYTRTYIDTDGSGVSDDSKPGLALVNTNIRYRDGSIGFFNNTDLNGYAGFNEVFPLMNWLVVDTTQTRFKPTWTHVIYDAGGPVDGSAQSNATAHTAGWTTSGGVANLANTDVRVPLPGELRVPGAKYCDNADCPTGDGGSGASTGMLFPSQAFSNSIGWQGLLGQNTFIEFGVKPFKKATSTAPAENGGIHGQVVYASTRPFDDPSLLLQLSWEPGIPNATINLYSKSIDANGNEVLKLVDTTQSASWDDWAQGFRKDANGNLMKAADGNYIPNMNCPGQAGDSPFFATLQNSKMWLDTKDATTHGSTHALAYKSQFKCYDGWSQLNQAQPAPYDGYYSFPSIAAIDPLTGKPAKSNCTGCVTNPDDGSAMLPAGTYVVEVIPPAGYEMVKEEDKNILMGDVYVAPVTQQFAGFGNIFIMPDQAAVGALYNASSPGNLNATNSLGSVTFPRHEGDTGSVEAFWPCVGTRRQVPDYNSEFPGAAQASPFAGAMRNLCDRKEVTVADESSALAKFYLFSSTHIAGHFAGLITNDFASEFDPFSPQFGEKFGPPNLPVGLRDFNGNEVARVYSDQWGVYNGLFYSTWSPNPPNPTGYAPQMSITCMNDPGPIMVNGVSQTDPAYNPAYSNFCYEQPFMPGETTYMDTPVIPTQAFADGYNLPDTEYPDGTPAIRMVVNSAASEPQGPWVHPAVAASPAAAASGTITFTNVSINNAVRSVSAGSTVLTGGTITCVAAAPTSCPSGNFNQAARNNRMATLVAASINARSGTTGYAATVGTGNNANRVTIRATATGPGPNGTALLVDDSGINIGGTQVLANGADAQAAQSAALGLTITALGDRVVQNPHFSGPNATTAPYNQKTITRHYGFGGSGTVTLVAPDGVTTTAPLAVTGSWGDTLTVAVPGNLPDAFNCRIQKRGAPVAQCGELVVTRGDNGKRSIDAITVTIGGSTPWVVTPTDVTPPAGKSVKDYGNDFGRMKLVLNAKHQSPIQVAIDSADPGDLVLVQPGTYRENLIMWKPVRLQGVGAAAVTVNGDAHPAGHMDEWRRQMVCVFGLTLDGVPNLGNDPAKFDASSQYSCPDAMFLKGDRIPFEAITGWQASGNGNLAQVLQEPTLLGAYEGAGITVVGRGVRVPANSTDFWGNDPTAAGAFPDGAVYLTSGSNDCAVPATPRTDGRDYGTSNFRCNPSSIDGLSVINSSQGGGGIFVHGWGHNLEIANNRVSANHGTLAGAVNLGNGETPPVYVNDGTICGAGTTVLCPPIPGDTPTGAAIPFGFNTFVRIHHNMLWNNASIGDALFTGTPAGAGGVTVSAGGDNYTIDHNWIAGNMSTGDGGGVQQLGVNFNGRIANNVIMFNQSTNPTLPTNGGGIVVQGANEPRTLAGTECGGATDTDCPPGLGDGTGQGLVIDANLIYGNSAESGTGGGIALEMVNGSEVIAFPHNPNRWYGVTLTNNIVANNVAGYDGGGVSLRDALKASLVNNTIVSNDTTASAGVLFKTLGAINASSPPPGCNAQTDPTLPQDPSCLGNAAPHGPQPSGLVTMAHTQNLNDAIAGLPGSVTSNNNPKLTCPSGYANGGNGNGNALKNADCLAFSRPKLVNNLFFQNRTFAVDIVSMGTGLQSQQNLVALAPLLNQTSTGGCSYSSDSVGSARFWDIGLRTDDVQSGLLSAAANKLAIEYSILTGNGDIGTAQETIASGTNRVGVATPVNQQICNGARVPPEMCASGGSTDLSGAASCKGFNAPPGASETTSLSTVFVFNGIQPTATVDEGHNWLNLSYGPLTLARPGVTAPTAGEMMVAGPATGTASGAYSIPLSSAAFAGGTNSGAPALDLYGNARAGRVDIGAVQADVAGVSAIVYPGSLSFGHVVTGSAASTQTLTLQNFGGSLAGISVTVANAPAGSAFARPTGLAGGSCGATLAANSSCTIVIRFSAGAIGNYSATVSVATTTSGVTITNSPVAVTGSVDAATFTATISPASLAFGSQATGSTSAPRAVAVTNTGNSALAGLNVAFGGGTPQPFSRPVGGAGGTCGNTLAVGATCTINVVFRPTGAVDYSRSLAVAATGATVTGGPVTLTGTGVAPATVSISAPTITLPSGALTGTGLVTLTNTATAGGASVTISNVATSQPNGTRFQYAFSNGPLAGPDGCTGATLAPQATCTVSVRFTNLAAARGTNRTGTITFTDNGAGSPQGAALTGFATR